jgi:glycosyltransferase involved in cell wall biosynthesis
VRRGATIAALIPALDEEATIAGVIAALPEWIDEVVVVDNGSRDRTAAVAGAAGARVVAEPARGYGRACLTGLAALGRPDVVLFLDGDHSDVPEEAGRLVEPILDGRAELVIGSRVRGPHEPGALTPQARFGNWLTCVLIRILFGERMTDLGPFRAIRLDALERLAMADPDYGWTVEMQVKALQRGLRVLEVPVSYRRRAGGRSKVSGTIRGVVGAGVKILGTVAWLAWSGRGRQTV